MRSIFYVILCSLMISFSSCKSASTEKEDKFQSIFNGEDMEGWSGDPVYWRVENGILIGEVTPETILKRNSFIIYEKEQPENFELKLEYRITESGNSGINYRSEIIETMPFALRGYQCDIDGKNKYTGQNYEEKKRTTLAYMGEIVTIPQMPDSIPKSNLRKNVIKNCWQSRNIIETNPKSQLKSIIKSNDWNSVHLIVKDNIMEHYINGKLISKVTDLDSVNRSNKGYIGVQVHVGPPMKVEFKNLKLKQL
ncbi:3-keto-disaccharide hydrolase [Algibacter sp.]|uniref:3-keto-disaccharide hydrolase n=1 Tax=Algibacter sp. TaxID=1872428 RepID=UPI003C746C1B